MHTSYHTVTETIRNIVLKPILFKGNIILNGKYTKSQEKR